MAHRDRIQRYRSQGGGADLIRVEVLVPADCRQQILVLAEQLRQQHRRHKAIPELAQLQEFRTAAETAFPGRVREVRLFGSRARGDSESDSDFDVAVFVEGFDRSKESRTLNMLAVPSWRRGVRISPIGIPVDRHGVSPELLHTIDHEGVSL